MLRRRRRNALLILVAGIAVVTGFVIWAGRGDSGPSGGAAEATADPLRVFVRSRQPDLPLPAPAKLGVTAGGGAGPLQVRVVATPATGTPVAGPWGAAATSVAIPAAVSKVTEAGSVAGYVEVRDAAGATARSGSIILPPTPGGGTAEVIRSVSTTKPYVALVFDDGLDQTGVARIISTLRATKSGGTFCFNGVNVVDWPTSLARKVQAAVADGIISLCSHGWGHRTSTSTTTAEAMSDLSANAAIDRKLGVSSVPFYRPPYGALSPGIEEAAGKLGYRWIVMWDVDPSDYERPGTATLVSRVVTASQKGSIVVLHAINPTADALPAMIRGLRTKGLQAVTLTTLFGGGTGSSGPGGTATTATAPTAGDDQPMTTSEGA